MGILNKLGDVAGSVSRNVNEKTKNISDTGELKRKISYEEERITEQFSEIGKIYYENRQVTEKMEELCKDIDTRKRIIKKMKFDLQGMKGVTICPNCKAQVQNEFQFCGKCGTKLPTKDDIE